MIDVKRKLKNFGPLEFLVLSSIFYVVAMLIWTASTRASVLQKANDIKSNHKMIVNFINAEFKKCEIGETHLKIKSWHLNQNINSNKNVRKMKDHHFRVH